MSFQSTMLLTSAFVLFMALPAHAEEQYIHVDDDAVHVQNGGQELHIDLKGGRIDIDNGNTSVNTDAHEAAPDMVHRGHASPSGTDFTNADLTGQSFAGRDLSGANFTNATLTKVSLRDANLQNADFTNADLTGCDLRGANVAGANFTNATFKGSLIKGVDFSGATLTNADMEGADHTSFVPTSSESISRALNAPTEKGKHAFINLSITFDFDKADVSPEGLEQIKELAHALQSTSLESSRLMIEGHTDSKGTDEYNMNLSKQRAQAIVAVLTNRYDISQNRLEAIGYGEMRPVAGNDTDFGRAQNRRVTIINMGK